MPDEICLEKTKERGGRVSINRTTLITILLGCVILFLFIGLCFDILPNLSKEMTSSPPLNAKPVDLSSSDVAVILVTVIGTFILLAVKTLLQNPLLTLAVCPKCGLHFGVEVGLLRWYKLKQDRVALNLQCNKCSACGLLIGAVTLMGAITLSNETYLEVNKEEVGQ